LLRLPHRQVRDRHGGIGGGAHRRPRHLFAPVGDVPVDAEAAQRPDSAMKILKRRHPHPEIPLVSTADVSFLLLIFFLSTTIFATQRGISLELPGVGELPLVVQLSKTARVVVAADQSVTLDDVAVPMETLANAIR